MARRDERDGGFVQVGILLRVDLGQVTSDWHNAYAQLVIELSNRLQSAPDDAGRLALINALKAELGGDALKVPPVITQPGNVVLHGEMGE